MLPAPGTSYTPINQVWACFAEGEEPPSAGCPAVRPRPRGQPAPSCSGGVPAARGFPRARVVCWEDTTRFYKQ